MTTEEAIGAIFALNGLGPLGAGSAVVGSEQAREALAILMTTSRFHQVTDDAFNFVAEATLEPGPDGKIQLPIGTITAVGVGDWAGKVTTSGPYLRLIEEGTNVFDRPVTVRLTRLFAFECVPEHVQQFLVADSAATLAIVRESRNPRPGNPAANLAHLRERRADAYARMVRVEAEARNVNMMAARGADFTGRTSLDGREGSTWL